MYEIYTKKLENGAEFTIIRLSVPYEKEKIQEINNRMDEIVLTITNGNIGNEFIEIHPDMPNIRVLIRNLNDLEFQPIGPEM